MQMQMQRVVVAGVGLGRVVQCRGLLQSCSRCSLACGLCSVAGLAAAALERAHDGPPDACRDAACGMGCAC